MKMVFATESITDKYPLVSSPGEVVGLVGTVQFFEIRRKILDYLGPVAKATDFIRDHLGEGSMLSEIAPQCLECIFRSKRAPRLGKRPFLILRSKERCLRSPKPGSSNSCLRSGDPKSRIRQTRIGTSRIRSKAGSDIAVRYRSRVGPLFTFLHLIHHRLPGPLSDLQIHRPQIRLGDLEIDRGLAVRCVFGVKQGQGIAKTFLFTGLSVFRPEHLAPAGRVETVVS